jgi:hypothetical protein
MGLAQEQNRTLLNPRRANARYPRITSAIIAKLPARTARLKNTWTTSKPTLPAKTRAAHRHADQVLTSSPLSNPRAGRRRSSPAFADSLARERRKTGTGPKSYPPPAKIPAPPGKSAPRPLGSSQASRPELACGAAVHHIRRSPKSTARLDHCEAQGLTSQHEWTLAGLCLPSGFCRPQGGDSSAV